MHVKQKCIQKYLANAIRHPGTMMVKLFHTTITGRTVFCSKRPNNLKKRQHEIVRNHSKQRSMAFVVYVCKTFIGFRVRQSKQSKENLACCTKLGPVSSQQSRIIYLNLQKRLLPQSLNPFKSMPYTIHYKI